MTREHYLHRNLTHHADWHLFRRLVLCFVFDAAPLTRHLQTSVRPVSGLGGLRDPDDGCLPTRPKVCALEASVASLSLLQGQAGVNIRTACCGQE